jgi:hypothetical protein
MNDSFSICVGFIVSLDDLAALLKHISDDVHCWSIDESDAEEPGGTLSVIIRYSNPGEIDLPNPISFQFPSISDGDPSSPTMLACLHSSLAKPVCRGLYLDDDGIKYDPLDDWARFWLPISEALLAQKLKRWSPR